jgi:hypothetical protein
MFNIHITKRDAAKYVAHCAVNVTVYTSTREALTTTFDIEPDSAPMAAAEVGSRVAGVGVMLYTWKAVDNAVDRVADWRTDRKEKKIEAKKSAS